MKTAIFPNEWQKFIFMSANARRKNVVKQEKNEKNLFCVVEKYQDANACLHEIDSMELL